MRDLQKKRKEANDASFVSFHNIEQSSRRYQSNSKPQNNRTNQESDHVKKKAQQLFTNLRNTLATHYVHLDPMHTFSEASDREYSHADG